MEQFFSVTSFMDTLLSIIGIFTLLLLLLLPMIWKEPRSHLKPDIKRWGLAGLFFSAETLALVWFTQGSQVLRGLGLASFYELLPPTVSFLVVVKRFAVVLEILCAVVALTLTVYVLKQSRLTEIVIGSRNTPAPTPAESHPVAPAEKTLADAASVPRPPARR